MASGYCTVLDLGVMEYGRAWALQRALAARRAAGALGDLLLLVEHPHVYTVGRSGLDSQVLLPPEALAERGVRVYRVDRGGGVTYHGPGQLVGYPILDLRRWRGGPVSYVRALEAALVEVLQGFGVTAGRLEGQTGVWVGPQTPPGSVRGDTRTPEPKIAAIGVRLAQGVTTHGFALNVDPELSHFDSIVPCGMPGLQVTSMARELGRSVGVVEVRGPLVDALGRRLGLVMRRPGEREAGVEGGRAPAVVATVSG